jgi:hypothetical protein
MSEKGVMISLSYIRKLIKIRKSKERQCVCSIHFISFEKTVAYEICGEDCFSPGV